MPMEIEYFEKTFTAMEESIKDLQESLSINKEMLKTVLSSGIDDDTLHETFYKITQENSKLIKQNQSLTKERDIALFKLDKAEFESCMAPIVPKSEDVRKLNTKSTCFQLSKIIAIDIRDSITPSNLLPQSKELTIDQNELGIRLKEILNRYIPNRKDLDSALTNIIQLTGMRFGLFFR